ncbi:zinc finger MYM-type protein 1-like [Rhopalosiphum padi]|uniref:zinc finger MYM-type protein 1-like n=1 Tax=Rhopalosiphum padi TaxID=40932 RepID=UPI00298E6AD8|nr:zinc finger MYM-type protein 1-like [Rhopalosiphum padi]
MAQFKDGYPVFVTADASLEGLSGILAIVDSNTNHNHNKNDEKVLNRQILSNSLKRKAIEDISCKPSKLIRSELKKGDISILTTNDLSLIRHNVHPARSFVHPPLPKCIKELHAALESMNIKTNIEFDLAIKHRPGSWNTAADCLSRYPVYTTKITDILYENDKDEINANSTNFEINSANIKPETLKTQQSEDEFCNEKCQLKSNRPTPNIALEYKEEKEWTVDGISSIKNFIRKSEKHSISKKHLINQEKFHLLGKVRIEHAISEGRRLAAIKHNEQVSINRRLIARMIHVVCFLGKQELAFRGHREHDESLNKGNYLELLDLLAQEEHLLKDHFLSSSIFKGTSKIIQNDLIESVTTILNSKIFKEIQTANYISIQADETTDVSCRSQMSIIFRYVIEEKIVERFIGFFDVSSDKTGSGLADVILSVIKKWDLGNKIIAQTYDGASVMSGTKNGVQSLIKNIYSNVLFIHCYAHQLNLVLLYGAKTIKPVKLFICNLTMFHTFFSRSSKRSELLRQQGFKLPNHSDTRWNYHSRAASTIKTHFIELKNAFTHVIEEPNWDHISISTASGILDKLNDAQFVYLLILFNKIFIYTDHVFNFLQSKILSNIKSCIFEIQNLKKNLEDLRKEQTVNTCCDEAIQLNNDFEYGDKQKNNLRKITYEILDSLIVQINIRFEDTSELEFVELTNEKMFNIYHNTFPECKLIKLLKQYPNMFEENRLRNELSVIYSDNNKHLPPHKLLDLIIKNNL